MSIKCFYAVNKPNNIFLNKFLKDSLQEAKKNY